MDDSEGPRSLFVVVFYSKDPHYSILQLETPKPGHIQHTDAEHLVCFNESNELPPIMWSFSPPITSTEDFYLFPVRCSLKPLLAYTFNFSTASFRNIPLPGSLEGDGGKTGRVVNYKGQIYRMGRNYRRSRSDSYAAESAFDCYDPEKNSWKALKPDPYLPYDSRVMATAIWNECHTILFNLGPHGIRAYDVHGDEWYDVQVNDDRCISFLGEAVVLGSTLYALTDLRFGLVLALSLKKEGSGGDLVFKCSVCSEISVPGMSRSIFSQDGTIPIQFSYQAPRTRTTHLVHLGKHDFCIVQSCDPLFPKDHKPIHVTYMSLTGKTKMAVTAAHMFKTRYESSSEVVFCFSMPKCKTSALEQGKPFVHELDPFTAEAHHSICVRDYPLDVAVSEVTKVLKKFGRIKRDGIQVWRSNRGNSLAYVEFESLISKQNAIKAKTVTLGGCIAEISEKA